MLTCCARTRANERPRKRRRCSIAAYSIFLLVLLAGIYGAYQRRLLLFKIVRCARDDSVDAP